MLIAVILPAAGRAIHVADAIGGSKGNRGKSPGSIVLGRIVDIYRIFQCIKAL